MDVSKLEKLKVVELKAELKARNLDVKGVKAVLIERLKDAIEKDVPLIGEFFKFLHKISRENEMKIFSIKTPSRHFCSEEIFKCCRF